VTGYLPAGTKFGPVDPVKYAEAFGAHGFMIQSPDQIKSVLKEAFDTPGPVLIRVHVDYPTITSSLSKLTNAAFFEFENK
jgi:thiamine pyrophosphate-dependent acetolactate synthase large subunit-like protein